MKVKQALPPLLLKYLEDLEADEKKGLSPDVVEKWKQAALDLTEDVMKYVGQLGTNLASAPEGVLGPLRWAIGKIAALSEAVTLGVREPDEEELCDLAKRRGAAKKELMAMGRDLMVKQPADTATEAHELVSKAGEAIKASWETIKAALRGMGAASDISEISCLVRPPRPPPARPSMGNLAPPAWPPQGTPATSVWPPPDMPSRATPGGAGDELVNLMRGLMGAQANDSGWPTFSGKYAEYPRFRKEWWAYRRTYHGHVRDELTCCRLRERSLASSVKILVNDIEDLREAWNTLDMCLDRPEKYIAEALEPIVKFRSYKMFDNGAIREFYSLPRAAMMGARKAGLLHRLINNQTLLSILAKMPPNDWRQWAKERPTWIREAIEEAFWSFVDQKWRDALNVAAAEPAGWGGRAATQETDKLGPAEAARKLAQAAIHVTAADERPQQQGDSGRQCIFADVLGCSGRHPPWKCRRFWNIWPKERERIIEDNRLCASACSMTGQRRAEQRRGRTTQRATLRGARAGTSGSCTNS